MPKVLAGVATALAALASLWLAFGPVYQGESIDLQTQETVRTTASLITANGPWVVPMLLLPVALTGVGLWATSTMERGPSGRRLAAAISTGVLILFCIAGIFSIGIFFLPAAGANLAAGIIDARQPNAPAHRPA